MVDPVLLTYSVILVMSFRCPVRTFFKKLSMVKPKSNKLFFIYTAKDGMSCYERNVYAWKETASLLWDISLSIPLPFQIRALSQILIFTSISEDVSTRVKAFHLG